MPGEAPGIEEILKKFLLNKEVNCWYITELRSASGILNLGIFNCPRNVFKCLISVLSLTILFIIFMMTFYFFVTS